MKLHCIVLSGGTGSRMGLDEPKQFLEIGGESVLALSFRALLRWRPDASFLCVAHPDYLERTRELLASIASEYRTSIPVVPGGETRHGSTLCGIAALGSLSENAVLLFHDAARPAVTPAELDRLADAFADPDCVVASLVGAITDTIVRGTGLPGLLVERLDRSTLYAVKTPQALRASVLPKLLALPEQDSFTDLLSWSEAAGIASHLVAADPGNIKLTHASDIPIVERFLAKRPT